jgi:hypothetical protein
MEEARRGLVKYETNIHPIVPEELPLPASE